MEPSPDELAGVADLFGALSAEEFRRAFRDLAARTGGSVDADALEAAIEDAESSYYLVALERGDETRYAPGPAALPRLPEHGEDLPHMMDVSPREVERAAVTAALEDRLRRDAAGAVADGDIERVTRLLDVAYEADAWGIDTADLRDRLDDVLE